MGLRIGDTLHAPGAKVEYPHIRAFAPHLFARAVNTDSAKRKQYQKGIEQLGGEGVVQILLDRKVGLQQPVAAAVGELQFEVFAHRMRDEFNVDVRLDRLSYQVSAQTRTQDLPVVSTWPNVGIFERLNGTPLVAFPSPYALDGRRRSDPEVLLDDVLE
jgi:peptide chain release factor 3